jgi:hypothetical protein
MLLKILPFALYMYKSSVSPGFAKQIMPILLILSYDWSLVIQIQSQSYIMTEGQSASLSWCQVPSGTKDKICICTLQGVVLN